jgi:hypothetical protein
MRRAQKGENIAVFRAFPKALAMLKSPSDN